MKKHIDMLGYKVTDKVTGFKGVVTCMSFDLYGCIQGVVTPTKVTGDKEKDQSKWFDVSRLVIKSKTRVMDAPDFDAGYSEDKAERTEVIKEGRKGAAPKPEFDSAR